MDCKTLSHKLRLQSQVTSADFASFINIITIVMMLLLQPALLYLVPACIGTPLLIACLKGEISVMFKYVSMLDAIFISLLN